MSVSASDPLQQCGLLAAGWLLRVVVGVDVVGFFWRTETEVVWLGWSGGEIDPFTGGISVAQAMKRNCLRLCQSFLRRVKLSF